MNQSTSPLSSSSSKLTQRIGPSVVDDVRSIRRTLDEQAGHDLHRLAEHARMVAEEFRKKQKADQKTDNG